MSEDITKLTFTIPSGTERAKKSFENVLRGYILNDEDHLVVVFVGKNVEATYEYCIFDEKKLEKILLELQDLKANNISCFSRYDATSIETVSTLFDGKMATFSSVKELEDFKSARGNDVPLFDYNKDRKDQTGIVRFHIKAKSKRTKLLSIFSQVLELKNLDEKLLFLKSLEGSFKAKTKDRNVKWCTWSWKNRVGNYSGEVEVFDGLCFVIESDEYLYLGFDLASTFERHKSNFHPWNFRSWENLIIILSMLDGVSKVWTKIRPDKNSDQELYAHFPCEFEQSILLDEPLSSESEWPQIYGYSHM